MTTIATFVMGVLLALLGAALLIFGFLVYQAFSRALRIVETALKGQIADMGREEAARLIARLPNAMVRKAIEKYVVGAGGVLAVSVVRNELSSRARIGLAIMIAGAVALALAVSTGIWLPRLWT
jgi:hypothetical protein